MYSSFLEIQGHPEWTNATQIRQELSIWADTTSYRTLVIRTREYVYSHDVGTRAYNGLSSVYFYGDPIVVRVTIHWASFGDWCNQHY